MESVQEQGDGNENDQDEEEEEEEEEESDDGEGQDDAENDSRQVQSVDARPQNAPATIGASSSRATEHEPPSAGLANLTLQPAIASIGGGEGAESHKGGDDEKDSEDEEGQNDRIAPTSVKERVEVEVAKQRARQKARYHSGKSGKQMGRSKGSKAKSDTRVRAGDYAGWD